MFNANWGNTSNIPPSLTCLGCKLTHVLRHEMDHYKALKRRIIRTWLHNPTDGWNDTDLDKALVDYYSKRIPAMAFDLDERRLLDMNRTRQPRDHELEEIQRELTWDETGKHGMRNRSPLVKDKDKVWSIWEWHREDRRFAHGY